MDNPAKLVEFIVDGIYGIPAGFVSGSVLRVGAWQVSVHK